LRFASQSGEGTSHRFGIRKVAANGVGTEEELAPGTDRPLIPNSWTSSALIYQEVDSRTRTDLWLLPLTPASRAKELVRSPAEDGGGQVSPDGRWFVYHSNESGRFEVYVRPFPSGAGKWQVSVSGGVFPRWQRDGRALFFMLSQTGRAVIRANVRSSGGAFESEKPEVLFDTNVIIRDHASSAGFYWPWAVAPDGRRFLIVAPANAIEQSALAVVMNWTEASSSGKR
jgi:WD40-like Beta Propeller Repeat